LLLLPNPFGIFHASAPFKKRLTRDGFMFYN
jgi:hypothetical protein